MFEVKTLTSGSIPNSSTNNEPTPQAQDLEDEAEDDVPDVVKLCEEGSSLPASIDDFDDNKDNGSDNSNSPSDDELKSLRRQPSTIISKESDERCLPEDAFSFFVYSHVVSRTFFLAIFVFLFQIAIYALLLFDITNLSIPRNSLNFPAYVETPVRIAEALAGMVGMITQDDVRKAVNLLRDGFDEELVKEFPGATKTKWILSILLRAIEGLFGLFLTFMLIMQSTTVLDLLLNFLAMEFVSKLDDVAFVLTKEGFFGRTLQKEAKKISNTYYSENHLSKKSTTRAASFVTVAYFIVLSIVFFSVWGFIGWKKQKNGDYFCRKIFVQYGDNSLPMLGTFTGLFYKHKQYFGGRLSYRNREDLGDGGALLAYCQRQKRWTLSLATDNVFDPCNWYAASSESEDFDVLTTANSAWVVKSPTEGVVPLNQHFFACYECRYRTDNFCGEFGKCANPDQCLCEQGHHGLRCEFLEPCQSLEIKQHDKGFVKTGGDSEGFFASKYYRLESVEAYNRPVYTSTSLLGNDQDDDIDIDFIVFTGVRWILSYKSMFPELNDVNDLDGLVKYFSQFHGHFSNYSASYVSEPVYIDTPVNDRTSPLDLKWLSASDEDQRLRPDTQKGSIENSFICAEPNDTTSGCHKMGYANVNLILIALTVAVLLNFWI